MNECINDGEQLIKNDLERKRQGPNRGIIPKFD
jgi:hypothetical protein